MNPPGEGGGGGGGGSWSSSVQVGQVQRERLISGTGWGGIQCTIYTAHSAEQLQHTELPPSSDHLMRTIVIKCLDS